MEFYIVNLASIFLWYIILYVTVKKKNRRKFIFLVICFLQLTVISALRDVSIGTDTKEYELWFRIFKNQTLFELIQRYGMRDIGYKLINRIIYLLGGNYRWLLWIEAICIMGSICYFIYLYAPSALTAIVFFIGMGYFQFSMNISRQMFAFAFVLMAFKYIKEKNILKYSVMIILASTIHFSAIFCIIFYLIFNKKSRDYSLIALFTSLLCAVFSKQLWLVVSKFIPQSYILKTTVGTGGEGTTILCIWILILIIMYCFFGKKSSYGNDNIIYVEKMLLSCAIICQSFVTILAVFGRMAIFFALPFYFLFSKVINEFVGSKNQKFVCIALCGIVFLYYVVIYLPSGGANTIPYNTCFN